MYYPVKAKVGTPKKIRKHHIENIHMTSTSFMLPNVPFCKRIIGKTKLPMGLDFYSRALPMMMPTMGEAKLHLNWFFVPCRSIMASYMEFATDSLVHLVGANSPVYITEQHTVGMNNILAAIAELNGTIEDQLDTNYDIKGFVLGDYATYRKVKFTNTGIQIYTILRQLGYDIIDSPLDKPEWPVFNAMPLLAFSKVILDYFVPKDWKDYEVTYNTLYSIFNNENKVNLSTSQVKMIFELMFVVPYSDDIFTTAWRSIGGPNLIENPISLNSITGLGTFLANDNNNADGTMAKLVPTGTPVNLTQQDLNNLKAFDKYLKKNQIVGTKYWDRLLAHYGITVDKATIKIPELIQHSETPMNITEIVSNAQTKNGAIGDNLGSYAGQGEIINPGIKNMEYFAEEEGYLMLFATIVPEILYANGVDYDVLHYDNFSIYKEEFDAQGVEAINAAEVYNGFGFINNWVYQQIFGFRPRYAALKTMTNKSTGLLSVRSQLGEYEKWSFTRYFDENSWDDVNITEQVRNSLRFNIGAHYQVGEELTPFSQFSRIFYYPAQHNFILYFKFIFDMYNSMKSLYDYEDIIDDDDAVKSFDTGNENV